ncbi:MAG: hypothetical protein P4L41_16380 [Flavipsychrobacter sp.]|nr:hypothetical protein [Flavipsychrobacter sp.]
MNQLTGQATPEQIHQWKSQYKQGIYAIEVDDHIAYFKNPNRHEMNCAMSKASAEAALDMYDELAKRTLIGGSEEVLDDDQKFFGVVQQIKVKMEGKKATLVNL